MLSLLFQIHVSWSSASPTDSTVHPTERFLENIPNAPGFSTKAMGCHVETSSPSMHTRSLSGKSQPAKRHLQSSDRQGDGTLLAFGRLQSPGERGCVEKGPVRRTKSGGQRRRANSGGNRGNGSSSENGKRGRPAWRLGRRRQLMDTHRRELPELWYWLCWFLRVSAKLQSLARKTWPGR